MRQSAEQTRYPLRIPSLTHEARRALLKTLADVAGFRIEANFPSDDRPDVLRRLVNGRGLFLGEAKYSEGPSNMASVARLDRYLGWLLPVQQIWWMCSARGGPPDGPRGCMVCAAGMVGGGAQI
jgi:hypothetical protein